MVKEKYMLLISVISNITGWLAFPLKPLLNKRNNTWRDGIKHNWEIDFIVLNKFNITIIFGPNMLTHTMNLTLVLLSWCIYTENNTIMYLAGISAHSSIWVICFIFWYIHIYWCCIIHYIWLYIWTGCMLST